MKFRRIDGDTINDKPAAQEIGRTDAQIELLDRYQGRIGRVIDLKASYGCRTGQKQACRLTLLLMEHEIQIAVQNTGQDLDRQIIRNIIDILGQLQVAKIKRQLGFQRMGERLALAIDRQRRPIDTRRKRRLYNTVSRIRHA